MLEGVRIVEVEGLGPGPFCGMLLADLGADVIVVHRPDGSTAPGAPNKSLLDRGKRSIALDLKNPDDKTIFFSIVKSAHGLIEGFRPGVMERLGLGPDTCMSVRPQLVYGRMTGWGQDGPLAQNAGHDLNYVSVSGAAWYASPAGEAPFTPPTVVGDIGGGALYLAVGLLSGILKARATGQGCVIDAAIVDGSAHMMNLLMSLKQAGGLQMERGSSLLDGPHWSRTYRTKDGGYFSVQSLEPKFYAIFLERMGLAEDPDFARQFDQRLWPKLTERLTRLFASRTRAEWSEVFRDCDACAAPVLAPDEALGDPHLAQRGVWQAPDGVLQAAAAPRFDGKPATTLREPPERDAHREEILSELERG